MPNVLELAVKHKEKEFKREKQIQFINCCSLPGSPGGWAEALAQKNCRIYPGILPGAGGSPEPAAALCPASRALLQEQHQNEQELGMLCRLSNAHCRGQICPLLWWLPALSANRTPGGLRHFSVDLGWGCCASFQPPPWCVQWGKHMVLHCWDSPGWDTHHCCPGGGGEAEA